MSCCLCEDLMVNIFERLPIISILRFRSLSKYWYSRIASHDFIRMHALRSLRKPQKVLIRHQIYLGDYVLKDKDIYTLHPGDQLPLDPGFGYKDIPGVEFPYGQTEIVGSCNGILCLLDNGIDIRLWNFSIRRKLNLPCHPSLIDSSITKVVALGFGFDPISDDYKVVGILNDNSFIYSIKTDAWNRIASPTTRFSHVKSKACFVNGALHWVVKQCTNFIMTFDLSTHIFGQILLPKPNWKTGDYIYKTTQLLTIINGCLGMISSNAYDRWIWVRREYGDDASWYVLFKFETNLFDVIRVFQPIASGDGIMAYNNKREVYNPHTGVYTKLLEFAPFCWKGEMDTYVESLELLDRGTSCGRTIFSWTEKDNKEIILDEYFDSEY